MKARTIFSNITTFVLVLLTAAFSSSCSKDDLCIRGNGRPSLETRSLPQFYEVVNNGSFEVRILPSNRYEVVIDAESNLIEYIRTSVSGGRLFVETIGNRCIDNTLTMVITVYTPYVDGLELNGSGFISAYDLYLDELQIRLNGSGKIIADADALLVKATVSGSGTIDLSGIAPTTELTISGSGRINAYPLTQQRCYATISGSGNLYVKPTDLLDVLITGSGNVYYKGNPAIIQRISGSGRIIRQ